MERSTIAGIASTRMSKTIIKSSLFEQSTTMIVGEHDNTKNASALIQMREFGTQQSARDLVGSNKSAEDSEHDRSPRINLKN